MRSLSAATQPALDHQAEAGAVELNIISQDTTDWGMDLPGDPGLASLLEEISELDGLRWIRLLYAYPGHVSDGLITAMRDLPKICPYLHIPAQSGSDAVLKRMRDLGIGTKRPATLYDIQRALKRREIVYEFDGKWFER